MRATKTVAVLCLISFLGAQGAYAQTRAGESDTLLILDASGSMWGQVKGEVKMIAARRAVSSILAGWKPGAQLGLMAYGHRSKSACGDIELIQPLAAVDAKAIEARVAALNPRGRTPIAASLEEAGKAMRLRERRSRVILVSDGIETCGGDPCAAAAALKKSGVDFAAHVIGLDIADPLARQQLQCIASATGGSYRDASDAGGLSKALGEAVAATAAPAKKAEAPAKRPDPLAGKNLRATVRLSETSDPIASNEVYWSLRPPGGDDLIVSQYVGRLAVTVTPQRARLIVRYGDAQREAEVEIGDKPVDIDMVLDAGIVVSAGTVAGQDPGEGIAWNVASSDGAIDLTSYEKVPRFVLPAGDYTMKLTKGQASVSKAFALGAGDTINLAIVLEAGRLLTQAFYAAGGPDIKTGIAFEVRKPAVRLGEEGEHVTTLYDAVSKFDLPVGEYDVTARLDYASKVERISVTAGQEKLAKIALDAGVVAWSIPKAKSVELRGGAADLKGERVSVGTNWDAKAALAINAGDYLAIVTLDDDTAVEIPFAIKAGARTDLKLP